MNKATFPDGHARIASSYKPAPSTTDGWLQHWSKSRHMHVPGKSGHDTLLEIADIEPSDQADLLVRTTNGKRFYVEFQRGTTIRARELPTFVVPNCNPRKGWWLLPPDG